MRVAYLIASVMGTAVRYCICDIVGSDIEFHL